MTSPLFGRRSAVRALVALRRGAPPRRFALPTTASLLPNVHIHRTRLLDDSVLPATTRSFASQRTATKGAPAGRIIRMEERGRSKVGKKGEIASSQRTAVKGAGRIRMEERGKAKGKKSKICSGCGAEVVRGSGSSKVFSTGQDALEGKSKRAAKKSRYYDAFDRDRDPDFLCSRCRALQSDDVWGAYDALHDVSPEIFRDQLRTITGRRQFGMCVAVVDATDPEHSAMKKLRQCVGKMPCWLVLNKVDLVPRMSRGDVWALRKKISAISESQYVKVFVVSAKTNAGIVRLAEEMLENLGGKDVFVVGSANVGKSTLVKKLSNLFADSIYMKGQKGKRRRDSIGKLNVTSSNLPGTTLQAIRIPCFPSDRHALWDTPGIINKKAVQYALFPSHLMEPLTRPGAIPIPTKENGRKLNLKADNSLLIEAGWMDGESDDESEPRIRSEDSNAPAEPVEPCVLGRVDVDGIEDGDSVYAECYLHPSLRIRVVPTSEAPDTATVPREHVRRVNMYIKKGVRQPPSDAEEAYSVPLKAYIHPDAPRGEVVPGPSYWNEMQRKFYMDLSFASLGWIAFAHGSKFALVPHCVEGSVFSTRPALYPLRMDRWIANHPRNPEHEPDVVDEEVIRRLDIAARRGRHGQYH